MKQSIAAERKADWSESSMNHLAQLLDRWLQAEARGAADADARASAVMQALPVPAPRRDLVAAVMAALAPTSLWARRPVRHVVAAVLLVLGVGVTLAVSMVPAWTPLVGLPVWRDLGRKIVVLAFDFVLDLVHVADTVWHAAASSTVLTTFFGLLPWLAVALFLTGAVAMSWISLWRDKESLRHV